MEINIFLDTYVSILSNTLSPRHIREHIVYETCCDIPNVIRIAWFRERVYGMFGISITRLLEVRSQDVTLHEFPQASVSEKALRNHRRVQRRNPRLNEITVNLTLCKSAVTIWSVLHMNAKGTAHLRRRIRP